MSGIYLLLGGAGSFADSVAFHSSSPASREILHAHLAYRPAERSYRLVAGHCWPALVPRILVGTALSGDAPFDARSRLFQRTVDGEVKCNLNLSTRVLRARCWRWSFALILMQDRYGGEVGGNDSTFDRLNSLFLPGTLNTDRTTNIVAVFR